ncbi:MAG: peptidylprolyl isomerase [bacterium]
MIRRISLAVLTGLVIAALVAGCDKGGSTGESKVVARAGDIEVTLADFQKAYQAITANSRPDISTLDGKRNFANDLVNQRILLAESERRGGIANADILAQIEQNRMNAMLGELYKREIQDKVEVLGSDVKELYDHRAFNVRASHILVDEEAVAKRIREEILSGKISFADAASKYSMDMGNKAKGGDLGEVRWGRTVPEFQKTAFELEPGKISEPIETNFGWHLILVRERVPQEDRASLEESRPSLRTEVRQQMEQQRMREYVATLQERLGLAWNEDAIETLRDGIREMQKLDIDTIPEADRNLPVIAPADLDTPLATWDGGEWTIADYIDDFRKKPASTRPPGLIPHNGLKELIRTAQIQNVLLGLEAKRLGFDKLPEVNAAADRLKEQVEVELVHSAFLQAADVPVEDVKAFYDSTMAENPDALMADERVDMLIVTNADRGKIVEALRRMRGGEDEAKVIAEISMDTRTNRRGGRTGLIPRGQYAAPVDEVAFSNRVGKGWSDPIVTDTGIGAVKVLSQEQPRPFKFEEIKDDLTRLLAQQRGERAFEDWLNQQRESRNVEIYDDVLELYGQPVS